MQDDESCRQIEVEIVNPQGLHARPVMRFIDIAAQFKSSIRIHKGDMSVDGKSPMEMMLLEGVQGTILKLEACGDDAAQALDKLAELVRDGFGEM